MSADSLKDVPEFFEVDVGESVLARTEALTSFRELGPPDLCHVTKTTGRSGSKDIGSYHFVSGVDASSSASLAAYINSLTYNLEETPGWFGGKSKSEWKVRHGVFCTFNAFSRVDVRVEVKIPGGVDAYVVDPRGDRHAPTPAIWNEVYLTSVLRSILYADDPNYKIAGYRKLDPIKTLEDEVRFLAAAESCYTKGWSLGSEPEIQVATNISNHLMTGIMKYFGDSGRYGPAVNLFEKLAIQDGEIASLLASAYIGMDEEVKAVQVLYKAIQEHPQSYPLLHVQTDFVRSKGKYDWAFKLARQAVNCAPSEFVTWAKLTEVNIELKHYDDALLSLNSCPMFTYNERDMHRMPTPSRTHLPVKPFILESGILPNDANDLNNGEHDQADIALLRLPAPNIKGTWKKAYELLTKIVAQIGWDELLRARSEVFVMEEEYRMQKQAKDTPNVPASERMADGQTDDAADDDASIRAMKLSTTASQQGTSPTSGRRLERTQTNGTDSMPVSRSPEPPQSPIPEIRISEHGQELPEAAQEVKDTLETEQSAQSSMTGPAPGVEKPPVGHLSEAHDARTDEIAKEAGETSSHDEHVPGESAPSNDNGTNESAASSSLLNKRLCERWLDNLFMVLYEDLRVYTIWRSEIAHYKAQHLPYRKTSTEWEILGDLAQRLHHREEAKDAYQRCIEAATTGGSARFPAKVWMKLLEYYVDECDVQKALQAIIRLSTYQHRWYQEMAYPTAIARQLYRLIQREGVSKISYSLVSMNIPQPVLKHCLQPIFHYAQSLQVPGSEY